MKTLCFGLFLIGVACGAYPAYRYGLQHEELIMYRAMYGNMMNNSDVMKLRAGEPIQEKKHVH